MPAIIYVGTKAGLFVSKDRGRTWQRQAGILGKSNILAIATNLREPSYIYIACIDGVFKTQNGGEFWEKIFTAQTVENNEDEQIEEGFENQDEEQHSSEIRYITIDPNNLNYLYSVRKPRVSTRGKISRVHTGYKAPCELSNGVYLVTSRGLYKSENKGESWESVSSYGLLSQDVRFLLMSGKSLLYAVTKSGIFEHKDER